jgi:hypothetical protein
LTVLRRCIIIRTFGPKFTIDCLLRNPRTSSAVLLLHFHLLLLSPVRSPSHLTALAVAVATATGLAFCLTFLLVKGHLDGFSVSFLRGNCFVVRTTLVASAIIRRRFETQTAFDSQSGRSFQLIPFPNLFCGRPKFRFVRWSKKASLNQLLANKSVPRVRPCSSDSVFECSSVCAAVSPRLSSDPPRNQTSSRICNSKPNSSSSSAVESKVKKRKWLLRIDRD